MTEGDILLERSWKFDKMMKHDCYLNKHSLNHKGKDIALLPLPHNESTLTNSSFLKGLKDVKGKVVK